MNMRILIGAGILAMVTLVAGCGADSDSSWNQQGNDASHVKGNHGPAEIGYMPDGFSNYATKCDRAGVRVYVIYHTSSHNGAIAVIPDTTCK
jgi:hypothetical protein